MASLRQLISGVVQGSVLGPVLFLLYVDDVVTLLSSSVLCKLYADDLKLYTLQYKPDKMPMTYRVASMPL